MHTQTIELPAADSAHAGLRPHLDPGTQAERSWTMTHARGFVLGLALCILGFWMPVIIGFPIWLQP